jgi:hypothetical protein
LKQQKTTTKRTKKAVRKSSAKVGSQKPKNRTADSSTTAQRTKKAVSKPKRQGANKAKSTAAKASSKKTGDSNPKAQATKKVKTPTGKASSTTAERTKQAGSEPKVQPSQRAKTSTLKASSTTAQRTRKVVSKPDIQPTEQPKFPATKASSTVAKKVNNSKVQPPQKAKTSPVNTSYLKKKTNSETNLISVPKVNRKLGRKAKQDLKASTIKAAFNKFQSYIVDLEQTTSETGRASQEYLFEQVKKLSKNHSNFPRLKRNYIPFGSFARKTKIRPLNDIDLLLLLNGRGISVELSYRQKASGYGVNMTAVCRVKITDIRSPLLSFADNKGYVNSIKILNRIKYHLASVPNYQKADKNRRMQAVTLNLKSHPWTFDIVPAIPIHDYQDKVTHFLIPDGYGNWIRTNPKIDAKSLTSVNAKHKGELLPVLRLLKYWNKRKHKPSLSSYYFETLVVQTFQYSPEITSYPAALEYFFHHCSSYIMSSCPDPKRLGEALDANVNWDTKQKILKALKNAASHACHAMMAESKNDQKTAIYWWKKVFGSEFPDYG